MNEEEFEVEMNDPTFHSDLRRGDRLGSKHLRQEFDGKRLMKAYYECTSCEADVRADDVYCRKCGDNISVMSSPVVFHL